MRRAPGSVWRLPALGGALYGGGFYAPLLVPTLIGFVPLLEWLERQPAQAAWRRLQGAFVFGFVAALFGLHFCIPMLEISWLAAPLYAGFALALGARIAACLALASWLRRRTGLSWALLLPATWIPVDWLQTFGDLRMTGDHPAHALAAYPFLIQFADVVGHYGVGAFALVVNGLLYEALLGQPARRRQSAVALGVLLAVVLGYDAWAWGREPEPAGSLRIGLVQPDIPLVVKHGEGTDEEQRRTLAELSRRVAARGAELVVWPESARPEPLFHWLERPESYAMPEVQALARELGAAFLVGVEYYRVRSREDHEAYNAGVLVQADGTLDPQWSAKVYLVPFAEATPFRRLLGPLVEGRGGEWHWLAGGFASGPSGAILDVDGAKIGLLVCYEQLFPDLARALRNAGAEILVVITNDAWYGRTPFQNYLANAPRLRAIESRAEFVRVANTGVSGFVDRWGRYHERTDIFVEAVAARDVPRWTERTVYDRLGDAVVWVAWVALGTALWLARGPKRRTALA